MVKRLVVTGYRPHELGIFNETHPGVAIIKEALRQQLLAQLDEGLEWVIVSGQLGVEAWTCDVVRELKEEYTHLKYAVLLPFQGQEERWNETN
ncbi:MAG TPA: SLOG family protein, partial [Savagea sp.]